MKTIAISIDEGTLEGIDRVARAVQRTGRGRRPNRSKIVREALSEYVLRKQRRSLEARERRVLEENRESLRREAMALVAQQAKL